MLRTCLFLYFCMLSMSASFSQEVEGKVMDSHGASGIAWVKVNNTRSGKFTYTDHEGGFRAFAAAGDTLVFSLKNFHSKSVILDQNTDESLVIYLEFDAIELPEVYVMEKNENTSIQLHGIKKADPDYVPIRPGQVVVGATEDHRPGLAMAGPISFFSKSEKNKRNYREAEELREAQKDYLGVIRSDSMRNELITHFSMTREKYDSLLILFNAANRHHQFRDMEKERVEKMLFYFMNDAVNRSHRSP
jgi:hypothetical protein